ncbi:MAG: hypothetical protein K2X93_01570 [Candidatus Obscuribacterales bacterium]|nr:hypothetical protein [Candidatus Obscuribacterales bacterium]
MLLVNLDPSYVGFVAENQSKWRHLSKEELTRFLVEMEAAKPGHRLPQDYQVRLPGSYSVAKLTKFGLLS